MKALCVWLTDRLNLQLHMYQLKTLIKIVKKTYRDFRLQGVLDGTLNNKSYETVYNRLTMEETTVAVKAGDGLQGITMRDTRSATTNLLIGKVMDGAIRYYIFRF
ncbi:unnamed protein product [Oncorhynchus mykiss]|uniref:MUN domain-containing protein n=1 Tax=Oncorhynchus mykiss TaxID=8022 RepID=A0A060YQU4_ONCMY|nr:unnamed protein product [Oncorhynchus mykiss]